MPLVDEAIAAAMGDSYGSERGCARFVLHTQSLDPDPLGLKPADLEPLSQVRAVHAQLPSNTQQVHALDDGGVVHPSACDT